MLKYNYCLNIFVAIKKIYKTYTYISNINCGRHNLQLQNGV